jgi:hypothetical protein
VNRSKGLGTPGSEQDHGLMNPVEDGRAPLRSLDVRPVGAQLGVGLLEHLEERELGVLLLGLLLCSRSVCALFAKQVIGALGHGQKPGFATLHLDYARALLKVDAEPLCDLAGGIEFQDEAADFGWLFFLFVFRVSVVLVGRDLSVGVRRSGAEGPKPHGREACVWFKTSGVGVLEDHREGLIRDGGPDVLQVVTERDNVAVRFLDPAVAAEDFEGRTEAGENRVRADDCFLGESRHPFMNSAGEFGQYVTPVANIVNAKDAARVHTWTADEMY